MVGPRYTGMTMNERLFEAGLVEEFDAAFRARDRAALIDIYSRVGGGEFAEKSVDTILANPEKYDPDRYKNPD